MARIRTIKPNFFKSQDVSELSYRARLTWIGLWTYVDDAGRGRDDARIIKGELWPLEDDVTWRDVEETLMELSLSLHVVRYTVENRNFLAIPKWLDHQVISRPSDSKFPAYTPENIRVVEPFTEDSVNTRGALPAGTGNREQGTGKGNREMELSLVATEGVNVVELFDNAYSHWPKKVKRDEALEKFRSVVKRESPTKIADAIERFGDAYSATTAKQFVPALGVWLNQKRWSDELPTSPESERKATRGDANLAFVQQRQQERKDQERRLEIAR
jgi:hypothetical protein